LGHAGQIEFRALDDIKTLRASLCPQYLSGSQGHRWIEAGGHPDSGRKSGHAAHLTGHAVRSVRKRQRRNTQRGYAAVEVLHATAVPQGYEAGLF
jgi:hypothetical protein